MSIFKNSKVSIKDLNDKCKNTMVEHVGMVFTEIGTDYLMATMPVDHRTSQPLGMLNGGASMVLAESLGSLAANLVLDRNEYVALGLDINGNHIKGVPVGEVVTGVAKPLHIGRTTQVWEVRISNNLDELVCISRLTMAVKEIK